jgi:hypothetical protein
MKASTLVAAFADNVNGATFIRIDTHTEVKLRGGKANPMQDRITKRVIGSRVMVFQNKKSNGYENMVKRRLENEGKNPANFTLSERKWGVRVPDMPIVTNETEAGTEYYLEVIFLEAGEPEYLLDGNPIGKDEIEGLPPVPAKTGQGGLNDQVIIRTYKAESILAVKHSGKEWR